MKKRAGKNMKYILGVDGGGSKTTVQITNIKGKLLVEKVSDSSSFKSVGIKKAIENLNTAVLDAAKSLKVPENISFASSCFGFAGNDSDEDAKKYKEIVFNEKLEGHLDQIKTVICNDTRLGLEIGSESKNKIILIAGTGSNCFGINEDGKQAGSSGWDYILADEGSGYETGLKALKAVMKDYDGRGEKTLLSRTIPEKLNLKGVPDLVKWAYGNSVFSKRKIAALAKTVCMTAGLGDKKSIKIMAEEAEEAAISVIAVAEKLGFKNKKFVLIIVGSLFKCKKFFKNILIERLKLCFPGISFTPLIKKPVEGAIKIAIESLKKF
jgi:N-acetylglucosamine kinase-like BadF-type ATPase